MSAIGDIMDAISCAEMAAIDYHARPSGMRKIIVDNETKGVRDLIATALADARREGAEQMRAEAAKIARALPLYYGSGDDGAEESLAQAIEDLPPPTGPRRA